MPHITVPMYTGSETEFVRNKPSKRVQYIKSITFDNVIGLHKAHYGDKNQCTGWSFSMGTENILSLAMLVTPECVVQYGQNDQQLNSRISTYKPVIQ